MSSLTTFIAKIIYDSPLGILPRTIMLPSSIKSRDEAIQWTEDEFIRTIHDRWVKAELFEYSRSPESFEVTVTPVHALRRSLGDVYRAEENYLSSVGFKAETAAEEEQVTENEVIASIPEPSKPISRLRVVLGKIFSSHK